MDKVRVFKLLVGSFVLIGLSLPLKSESAPKKEHRKCSSTELKQRSCDLRFGAYHLTLNSEKVIVNDGVWRSIQPLPFVGEKVAWQRVRVITLGSKTLLELLLWDEPNAEAQVQRLQWVIMNLRGSKVTIHKNGVVQRRWKSSSENIQNYIKDRREKFGLKLAKKGKVQWSIGSQKGFL